MRGWLFGLDITSFETMQTMAGCNTFLLVSFLYKVRNSLGNSMIEQSVHPVYNSARSLEGLTGLKRNFGQVKSHSLDALAS